MSYSEIYNKRLNRYGTTYQTRVLGERVKLFDEFLAKSLYRVDFTYDYQVYPGSFEKLKQDMSETRFYLLTHLSLNMPNGTILELPDKDNELVPWMIYSLEVMEQSGYNRYTMLKMTHQFSWTARDGQTYCTLAYLYGQEDNMLKDEIRSRSRMDTIYAENLKSSFFVCPCNEHLKKDDYLIIGEKPLQEYFRVTGYDIQSTPGVEIVTIDPVYEFDLSAPPAKEEGDDDKDFFWFNGGFNSGT